MGITTDTNWSTWTLNFSKKARMGQEIQKSDIEVRQRSVPLQFPRLGHHKKAEMRYANALVSIQASGKSQSTHTLLSERQASKDNEIDRKKSRQTHPTQVWGRSVFNYNLRIITNCQEPTLWKSWERYSENRHRICWEFSKHERYSRHTRPNFHLIPLG